MLRVIMQSLKILTIGVMTLLVAAGGVRVFDYAVDRALPADTGERVEVTISEDDSAGEVADRLADAGLIRSKLLFTTQMRVERGEFVSGNYQLRKGMTIDQIIGRISRGELALVDDDAEEEPAETVPFSITIPEGWRTTQIAELYAAEGNIENGYEEFMAAVEAVDPNEYAFLADRPAGASLEGYLFPDTYDFIPNDAAYNVRLMLNNFDQQFTAEMRARAAEMNLSVYDVLTFASLVEREAQIPEERPIIADVYLSRYQQGWKLDADPTVQYVLGDRQDWWPQLSGDDLFAESPYNTYQNEGLPPGPIANPGIASIQAVLFPEETDYMYFVAKGDTGEHAFARTLEEQQANIDLYLNTSE